MQAFDLEKKLEIEQVGAPKSKDFINKKRELGGNNYHQVQTLNNSVRRLGLFFDKVTLSAGVGQAKEVPSDKRPIRVKEVTFNLP